MTEDQKAARAAWQKWRANNLPFYAGSSANTQWRMSFEAGFLEALEEVACAHIGGRMMRSSEAVERASAAALAMEGAPTIKDAVMRIMRDHYWDSLTPQKELILKHIEGALRPGVSEGSKP